MLAVFLLATFILTVSQTIASTTWPIEINVAHFFSDLDVTKSTLIFEKAVNQLKIDGWIPPSLHFNYKMAPACAEEEAFREGARLIQGTSFPWFNVLFGPTCSEGMNIAAIFAAFFDLPVMGYISVSDNLANKTKYPTLIRSSFTMGPLGISILQLLKHYEWKQVAIIRSSSADCSTALSGIIKMITDPASKLVLKAEITADSDKDINQALSSIATLARIVILCFGYEPASANKFLISAYQKGMTTPDYVYIIPYYLKLSLVNWIPWQQVGVSEGDKAILKQAYQRVLIIEATGVDANTLSQFQDKFENADFQRNVTMVQTLDDKESIYFPFIHDSMYLYCVALNRTIRSGGDFRKGSEIVANSRLVEFNGVTGRVVMSNDSDRVPEYFIFGTDRFGNYTFKLFISAELDLQQDHVSDRLDTDDLKIKISVMGDGDFWPTPDGRPPNDRPVCGFVNELCTNDYSVQIGTSLTVVFVVLTLLICVIVYYKRKRFQHEIMKMSWKIRLSELKIISHSISFGSSRTMSRMSASQSHGHGSHGSPKTILDFPERDFTAYYTYKGSILFAKNFEKKKQVAFTADELLLLKNMKDLRHDNVNYFIGMVVDDGPFLIVLWKYCEKGSLQDIIYNADIHLDLTFITSIIKDVICGLEYLHKSYLQIHGNLTSRNCLVDSRWTVRLTDYGLQPFFTKLAKDDTIAAKLPTIGVFHRAPEQLRHLSKDLIRTKQADIYSLSMVIYQVLFRVEPFADEMLSDDDIMHNILSGGRNQVRPAVPVNAEANPAFVELMHKCWNEDPTLRPTISEVKTSFIKSCGKNINISLMDHVMSMLEKYATNLEKIVDERTQQLVQERKRADQLLYQMLPRIVADKLKNGDPIYPESYDIVTIYFSDIVSFTVLSSMSTPMQVVTFLNTLYSQFDETIMQYDVYKVETIGDAYMVVSGLPHRNGTKHVTEICDMALGILQLVMDFKIPHIPERKLEIRIGIHSGPVAAGVVGLTMPRYCLFGDTVNTASRMESSGKPCKIQISESCRALLSEDGSYSVEPRGTLEIKGKGLQNTYWLLGKLMYAAHKTKKQV